MGIFILAQGRAIKTQQRYTLIRFNLTVTFCHLYPIRIVINAEQVINILVRPFESCGGHYIFIYWGSIWSWTIRLEIGPLTISISAVVVGG